MEEIKESICIQKCKIYKGDIHIALYPMTDVDSNKDKSIMPSLTVPLFL